ncbi:MAG: hypothetical protein DDT19_01257 [Syntrophomonadaceae bacterium]|nr:hypothetical protein [Bacillota bacterium]
MKIHIDGQSLSKRLAPGSGGIYRAVFSGRRIGVSKTSGNPTMNLELTIQTQGPNPDVKTVGKAIYDVITFTEDSLWRANLLYNVVTGKDIPEADYTADELFALLWNTIANKVVTIEVQDDTYEGVTRPKVTRYLSLA